MTTICLLAPLLCSLVYANDLPHAHITIHHDDVINLDDVANYSTAGTVDDVEGLLEVVEHEDASLPNSHEKWVCLLLIRGKEATTSYNRGIIEDEDVDYDVIMRKLMMTTVEQLPSAIIVPTSNVSALDEKLQLSDSRYKLPIILMNDDITITLPPFRHSRLVIQQVRPNLILSSLMNGMNDVIVRMIVTSLILVIFLRLSWSVLHCGLPFYTTSNHVLELSRQLVAEMKIVNFRHRRQRADESCSICLEAFHSMQKLRLLPCSHRFHVNCVDAWLIRRRFCPLCKYDIIKKCHPTEDGD